MNATEPFPARKEKDRDAAVVSCEDDGMNSLLLIAYGSALAGGGLISLLISLLVLCIVCAILWWIINLLPLPSPWRQIILAIFALIILLVVLQRFLGLAI